MSSHKILVINPGSTSTKVAVFDGGEAVFRANVSHEASDLARFASVPAQLPYRKQTIDKALAQAGVTLDGVEAVAGRGGGLAPLAGGTFKAEGLLLEHARIGFAAMHPATLGAQLADLYAADLGVKAYVVNPPDVDELQASARFTGVKGLYRQSRGHPLNQKEVAHRYAATLGKEYEDVNVVVAHVGGGVSVGAHLAGRLVDCNDVMNGDGPMAPTRCGALPAVDVARMTAQGSVDDIIALARNSGGLVSHLGTSDSREVIARIEAGDAYAEAVYDAMIYQIGKAIGAMVAVLHGRCDGIVITGGIAHDPRLVNGLTDMVGALAPIAVIAGELEMEGLASGVSRVLDGEEEALTYTAEPVWVGPPETGTR